MWSVLFRLKKIIKISYFSFFYIYNPPQKVKDE